MPRPTILVVPPRPLFKKLFSDEAEARLATLGSVICNEGESDWTAEELLPRIREASVLVTGWRTPRLTDDLLDAAPALKLIAHSAGSVKFMLDERVMERGILVSTAGAAMVTPVAETTLLLCMLMLRPLHRLDAGLRAGASWAEMKLAGVGEELGVKTVGIIGAGQIGKRVIRMLRALEIDVRVFDPYLSRDDAERMGVTSHSSLDEMLGQCHVVTLHAPVLPETAHLIGAKQLAAMRDGAILINTARSMLVDTDALAKELRAGRLHYATDVYDNEPLPVGDPWRSMPNTFILPHIASSTRQAFRRQGDITVSEVERFLRGETLQYPVTPQLLKIMA